MGVFECLHKALARVPRCKNRVFGCLHRGVSLDWLMQKNALVLTSWDAPSHRFQQAWLVLTSGAAFGVGPSGLAWPTNKTLPRRPGARVTSHSHPPRRRSSSSLLMVRSPDRRASPCDQGETSSHHWYVLYGVGDPYCGPQSPSPPHGC